MMAVTQKLAKETFNIEQNGKSICYKIVPQFSSSLRKDLVLWKKDEKLTADIDTGTNPSEKAQSWETGTSLSLFDHEFYSLIQ